MQRSRLASAAAAAAAFPLVAGLFAAPAQAAPDIAPRPVAKGLITPLSLAVTPSDTLYVSQNFAGLLMKKRPGHPARVVFQAAKKNTEVGAVSFRERKVTFATTWKTEGKVWRLGKKGKARLLGDVGRIEHTQNPDEGNVYGFTDLDEECAAQWPAEDFGPPSYPGIDETHPYATEMTSDATYVADAAGNTILAIAGGDVRVVSVLPPVPVEVTAEAAEGLGLPECVVGHDYNFEPVPTDVEMGPDGMLYVTSLPGGPEDDSLGANGSVFRVDPATGDAEQVVTGLVSATGLDVAPNGDLYVAQLFAASIVRVPAGADTAEPYKSVALPADVEWRAGRIFATTNVLAEGPQGKVSSWAD
jgi:hypothetical protein